MMDPSRFAKRTLALSAYAAIAIGCSSGAGKNQGGLDTNTENSVVAPQTPLDGTTIPRFVTPLTTFTTNRVNGNGPLQVVMQEFQQQVLPASFYAGLPAPFNRGTFLWGYNINGAGPSWPARTIETKQNQQTVPFYVNSLRNTQLQKFITVDQALHWADPLHTTANNNCVNGPPLAAPCQQPYAGPIPTTVHLHGAEVPSLYDGHPDTWFTDHFEHTGRAYTTQTYIYGNTQQATTLWDPLESTCRHASLSIL